MTASTGNGVTDPRLGDLVDRFWKWRMEDAPEFAHVCGHHIPDVLDKRSLESFADREAQLKAYNEELAKFPADGLNRADSLSLRLLKKSVAECLYGYTFRAWLMPLSLLEGPQVDLPNLVSALPFNSEADYRSYINKLKAIPAQMDENISLLNQGIQEGRVPPKETMHGVPDQLAAFADAKDATALVFYKPFASIPPAIPAGVATDLQAQGKKAIEDCVIPAFGRLHEYAVSTYIPACRDEIACTALPNGSEHYAQNLRVHTSTDLTAQQIHDLGLSEVDRIHKEMDRVLAKVNFDGDFNAFTTLLRSDKRFYASKEDELLDGYRALCAQIHTRLPATFGTLCKAPYEVRATPAHQAPQAPSAYYLATSTGGTFYVNTHKLDSRPMYEMEALALHECLPGHHFQGCIAMETALPPYRRYFEDRRYFEFPSRFSFETAYLEGWGLYSESIGEELGLYTDPYQKFGALSMEMWRALRLVVDTGMHALGWSQKQAGDFMELHTGLSRVNIDNEVRRYIAVPGQACAYKIGQLEITRLRKHAQEQLGAKFDVREFHDTVLCNGPVPMTVLSELVDDYIASKR